MLRQQRHAREGLGAVGAGIFLDVRMRLQMRPQIGAIGKGAMTMLATEGFLTRVGAYVSLQQPGPRECLATHVALAR